MDKNTATSSLSPQQLARGLEPYFTKQFKEQLTSNAWARRIAVRLLDTLKQDPKNELGIQPLDLFSGGHLNPTSITEAAEKRAIGKDEEQPHLKSCSLCNAFVEREAAQIIVREHLGEAETSGVEARIPQRVTDNQKWFGASRDDKIGRPE